MPSTLVTDILDAFAKMDGGIHRMNEQVQVHTTARETLARIEEHVRCRLTGLLVDFRLVFRDEGLVLRGRVCTYYAKQLAQHAVMEASGLPIRANEIEVA